MSIVGNSNKISAEVECGLGEILEQEFNHSGDLKIISAMDFIKLKAEKSFQNDCSLSTTTLLLLELATVLFIGLNRWMYVHFLKKSETYFTHIWFESLIVVLAIRVYLDRFTSSVPKSLSSHLKHMTSMSSLIFMYVVEVIIYGIDFITFTRKAGGTEFYQFCFVLTVPILLIFIRTFHIRELPPYIVYPLVLFSGWKVMFLLQDQEFTLTFSSSIWCLLFTLIVCSYLVLLKANLQNSILDVMFNLSFSLVLMLPLVMLLNGELSLAARSFGLHSVVKGICKCFLFAFLKLCSTFSTLLLLKKTDLLTCIAVINFAFIPDHFNQALVYKLDCTLAASKICFFVFLDYLVMLLSPKIKTPTMQQRDQSFSLMT